MLWTILGDAYFDDNFVRRGVEPIDIAGSATGRLAVAGRFHWSGGHSAYLTSYAPQ